ncbi:hypothetical protein D3C75_1202820 [compost metagenome]
MVGENRAVRAHANIRGRLLTIITLTRHVVINNKNLVIYLLVIYALYWKIRVRGDGKSDTDLCIIGAYIAWLLN